MDKPGTALVQSASRAQKDIESTLQLLSQRDLDQVSRVLCRAGIVLAIGLGGSLATAVELAYRLTRLGIDAIAIADRRGDN